MREAKAASLLLPSDQRYMLPQESVQTKDTPPRLLVDAMLGRLARWLRLMGYDAAYWRDGSDLDLIRQACAEQRLIVTRDRQLAGRRGILAVLVASESLNEQIAEMRAVLASRAPAAPEPFTRCPECNGELHDLSHEDARDLVPPYVWHTQHLFRRCPDCGRVYWRGTHWPGMSSRLETDP
jgi:uncharacterized protein with PIN domain